MAPKARVRANERRKPSGRLVQQDTSMSPAEIRRAMRRAREAAKSHLLGTEIGRLLLTGFLAEHHAAASDRWLLQYSRYCRVMGIPQLSARAQDLTRIHGADDGDIDSDIARRWTSEYEATESYVGRSANEFIKSCVADDRIIATFEARLVMRKALENLAVRWGLA